MSKERRFTVEVLSLIIAGRGLNSLKKVAGIKCRGKKRLTMLYPERAPMGLNFLSKNEFDCQR
jgi:hypothetical protein